MDIRRNKRGFTLAELLIVVAIIGVLVAVAIPVFTSSLEKARAATCLANRTSLQHMLTYGAMMDKEPFSQIKTTGSNWEEVKTVLEKTGNSFTDKICPSGGEITVTRIGDASFSVTCSLHQDSTSDNPESDPSQTLLKGFYDIFPVLDKTGKWYSNDQLREALWGELGKWPTMTIDGKQYQIEPYTTSAKNSPTPPEETTTLFAKLGDGTKCEKNWKTRLVYDPIDGNWYQCISRNDFSMTEYKSHDNPLEYYHNEFTSNSDRWKQVTVTYN